MFHRNLSTRHVLGLAGAALLSAGCSGSTASTVEPLSEHLDHYERMLLSNLACGAQACYREPRLCDTDAVKEVVQQWVDWVPAISRHPGE